MAPKLGMSFGAVNHTASVEANEAYFSLDKQELIFLLS